MAVGDITNLKATYDKEHSSWNLSWATEGLNTLTDKLEGASEYTFARFTVTIISGWPADSVSAGENTTSMDFKRTLTYSALGLDASRKNRPGNTPEILNHQLVVVHKLLNSDAQAGCQVHYSDRLGVSPKQRFEVRIEVQCWQSGTNGFEAVGKTGIFTGIYITPSNLNISIAPDKGSAENPPDKSQYVVTWPSSSVPSDIDNVLVFPQMSTEKGPGMDYKGAMGVQSIRIETNGEQKNGIINFYNEGTYYIAVYRQSGPLEKRSDFKTLTVTGLTPVFPNKKGTNTPVEAAAEWSSSGQNDLIVRWPAIQTRVDYYLLTSRNEEWRRYFTAQTDPTDMVRTVYPIAGDSAHAYPYHEVTLKDVVKISPDKELRLRIVAVRNFHGLNDLNFSDDREFVSQSIQPATYPTDQFNEDGTKRTAFAGAFMPLSKIKNEG